MSMLNPDQQRARFFATRASVTVIPGETWEQYRDRMWRQSAEDTKARPIDRHRLDRCNCPSSYSLCVYAMYWRMQQPDWTKDGQTHGGWGWTYTYLPPSHPDHQHPVLVDGTCAWAECGQVTQTRR